jgi:hypothetical protein
MNNGWEISIGLYPGVLFGVRTYEISETETDHLFYLPLIYLCLTTIKDE